VVSPDADPGSASRRLRRRTTRTNPITPPITRPAAVAKMMTRASGASNCQKRKERVTACPF
jgi:hypothetical protein